MSKKKETLADNFTVEIGLFSQQVMFHFGDTGLLKELLEKYANEAVAKEVLDDINSKDALGTTFSLPKGTLVYLPDKPKTDEDYGVLAHEILHAVFKVAQKIGVEYSPQGEELYTYLMQYLTQAALEELRK